MQKYVNLVDLVKSFPTSIYLQKSASIQPRTSLSKIGGQFNLSFIRLLGSELPRFCPRRRRSPNLPRSGSPCTFSGRISKRVSPKFLDGERYSWQFSWLHQKCSSPFWSMEKDGDHRRLCSVVVLRVINFRTTVKFFCSLFAFSRHPNFHMIYRTHPPSEVSSDARITPRGPRYAQPSHPPWSGKWLLHQSQVVSFRRYRETIVGKILSAHQTGCSTVDHPQRRRGRSSEMHSK